MTDSLGWRMKIGVVVPSTNTSVQPEYDDMRPRGVTNHFARAWIPDSIVNTDEQFMQMMANVRNATDEAVDAIVTCSPGYLVMGMSLETFWDGLLGAEELKQRLEHRAGVTVGLGSHACKAAIRRYGSVRRIGVITPYMPIGDLQVRRFFTECGFEVVHLIGLECKSPTLIAHESQKRLRRAVQEVNDSSVELIIQVGTNLAFGVVAAEAERWLDKPVLAINTCTYWHALRENGISDKVDGFGSLLADY